MTAEIERALREKCSLDPRLELLQAQWAYDKRLVSQALQTVGNTFPHYSQHDASHSSTILVQITRVLGARIDLLSATDLWLLLESAYWHDIGMIVDDATLRKWWDSSDFRSHIDTLADSTDDVLASAARLLKDRKLRCDSHDLDIRNAITLVAADYARGLHADRSGELVNRPLTIGLQSPRMLIPSRLFYWLGQIATSHGRSDAFVNALPQSEAGMGTDVCHPRFVARMLRLGDLLDLDNGRFCPVLLSMVGRIPASSLAHIGKHGSIRHFCVGPEKIEVTAVCEAASPPDPQSSKPPSESGPADPYASYEAVATWLVWLEKELAYLASHWADIAPPNFGGAPSIGTIEARLNDYICLKDGERPRFRVDETAFLALVRSNTLYQDKHAWLRELLANAEDATRIRAFVEHKSELLSLIARSVPDPIRALADALEEYPITVAIENVKERGNQVHVSISDNGTGISLKDLEYILTIGSSRKNPARKRIVGEMPGILRPTGAFGIGLQSVFMVTDEIVIDTLHFRSRDRLSITIRRKATDGSLAATVTNGGAAAPKAARDIPTGVYVRQVPEGQGLSEPGTRIQFFVTPEPALPPAAGHTNSVTPAEVELDFSPSLGASERSASKSRRIKAPAFTTPPAEPIDAASRFDPILTEERGLEAEVLKNLVEDIAHRLAAPIILNGLPLMNDLFSEEGFLFSHAEQCAILFRPCKLSDNRVSLRYRGAEVRNHNLADIGLLDIVVDLHFGGAAEILTASRDSLTPYGNAFVQERVNYALADVFPRYLKMLEKQANWKSRRATNTKSRFSIEAAESLAKASLFAKVYLRNLQGLALSRKWEDVPIALEKGDSVSLSRLVSADSFDISIPMSNGVQAGTVQSSRKVRNRGIPQFTLSSDYPNCVRDILLNLEKNSQLVESGSGLVRYRFGATEVDSIESQDFERMLVLWPSWNRHRLGYFRPTFPAPPKFARLALNFNQLPNWALQDRLLVRSQFVSPLEFCFDSATGDIIFNTAHLPFYIDWICSKTKTAVDAADERRQSVIEAVREFCKLLPSIGRRLLWQDGNEKPVEFQVGMIDRIFARIT